MGLQKLQKRLDKARENHGNPPDSSNHTPVTQTHSALDHTDLFSRSKQSFQDFKAHVAEERREKEKRLKKKEREEKRGREREKAFENEMERENQVKKNEAESARKREISETRVVNTSIEVEKNGESLSYSSPPMKRSRISEDVIDVRSPTLSPSELQKVSDFDEHLIPPARTENLPLHEREKDVSPPEDQKSIVDEVITIQDDDYQGDHENAPSAEAEDYGSEILRNALLKAKQKLREEKSKDKNDQNPILEVFIDTQIPNTEPTLVKIRFKTTAFRDIKNAWCDQNGIADALRPQIMLFWNGNRVFESATAKTLGLVLNEEGIPVRRNEGGYSETIDRITLIITTEKLKTEESTKIVQEQSDIPSAVTDAPPSERQFRLILRSKTFVEHKLVVRMSTQVKKIIASYRKVFKLSPTAQINILLDGEVLNPDVLVKDSPLVEEDENEIILLDVSVKS